MAKVKQPPIPAEAMPKHIAFIMDGNGRWAKRRGLPRTAGHAEGARNLKKLVRYCKDIGIENITFYAFSTENWKRPEDEVHVIMKLLHEYALDLRNYFSEKTRLIVLGDKTALSVDLRQSLEDLEKDTLVYEEMNMALAINYGSRDEITRACRILAQQVKDGKLNPEDITEDMITENLYTKDLPDVDLLIRPGGEYRLSNYLLWQCAYAELYFCDTFWPDFGAKELDKALVEYANRNRRFGGL